MKSFGRLWFVAIVLTALAAGGLPRAVIGQQIPSTTSSTATQPSTAPIAVAAIVQAELEQLTSTLNDPQAPQDARDQAAARLASRPSSQTRRILRETLINSNTGGELAVARALASLLHPDPDLIPPLINALSAGRIELVDAAARALAGYKGNQEVLSQLIALVRRRPQPFPYRLQIITALGSIDERRSAELLVSIVNDAAETASIRSAACSALIKLTGLEENGQSPELWNAWSAASPKADAEFRVSLTPMRSRRYDRNDQTVTELNGYIAASLNRQYSAATPAQRPDLLLTILKDPLPEARAVGASIARENTSFGNAMSPQIIAQLRKMIGDSDPEVRKTVAQALAFINDADSLNPLLGQLAQESDAEVRAALISAMAPITNVAVVPSLLERLSDPALIVQMAAIKTLGGDLGAKISENPELARRTANALREVFDKQPASNEEIRRALVQAMTPLHVDSLLPTFYRILNESQNENAIMRRFAIRAIGEFGKAESAPLIATSLDDLDGTVRLEAITALGKLRKASDYAQKMADKIRNDGDKSVRDAAWANLRLLLNDLTPQQLIRFADSFRDDPAKQREFLESLRTAQIKLLPNAQAEDDLLSTRQNLAAALATIGEHANAAAEYDAALNSATLLKKNAVIISSLRDNLMEELLMSRQYDRAVAFAANIFRDPEENRRSLSLRIKARAEKLAQDKNYADAKALINEVKKMDPQLSITELYKRQLDDIEKEVDRASGKSPQGPGANASAPVIGRQNARVLESTASGQ